MGRDWEGWRAAEIDETTTPKRRAELEIGLLRIAELKEAGKFQHSYHFEGQENFRRTSNNANAVIRSEVVEARRLRANGLIYSEIGQRLGRGIGTVFKMIRGDYDNG